MSTYIVLVLTVLVVGVQALLAFLALRTGLSLSKDKTTQEALPLIALVVAPALTIGTSLTPVVVILVRALETGNGGP